MYRTKNFSKLPLIGYLYTCQLPTTKTISKYLISTTTMASTNKPPVPPFTEETARIKVKAAQDVWNTKYEIIVLPSHHLIELLYLIY